MTDQSSSPAAPTPWYWESVKDPSYIREHTLEGPDVLCRYWHDVPPSADALLIAAAPETAAERDRLVAALTPSVETKRAYMGEFSYGAAQIDEDGNPQPVTYYVPWTTIKEIMAAILAEARKR